MKYITVGFALLLGAAAAAAQETGREQLSPARRAKAEALLAHKLPCLGCHTLGSAGGRIGPDLNGIGVRLDGAQIRQRIEQPAGLMPRIPLDPGTLALLVDYLAAQRGTAPDSTVHDARGRARGDASLPQRDMPQPKIPPQQNVPPQQNTPPRRNTPQQSTPTPTLQVGPSAEELYVRHCSACHGDTGNGDGWNAPYLDRPPVRHADARAMGARTDDRLFDAIYAGSAIMGGSARMPPFGGTLTVDEIRLLVTHIRRLCRCQQPPWARDGG